MTCSTWKESIHVLHKNRAFCRKDETSALAEGSARKERGTRPFSSDRWAISIGWPPSRRTSVFNDTAWCGGASSSVSSSYAGLFVIVRWGCRSRGETVPCESLSFFSACRIHAEARRSPDVLGRKRDGVRRRRDAGSTTVGGDGRGGPKDLRDAPYLLAPEGQSMAPHRPFSHRDPTVTLHAYYRESTRTHAVARARNIALCARATVV